MEKAVQGRIVEKLAAVEDMSQGTTSVSCCY